MKKWIFGLSLMALSAAALPQTLPRFGEALFGAVQFGVATPANAIPVNSLWLLVALAAGIMMLARFYTRSSARP